MSELVSVITATTGSKYLTETLKSVAEQTYDNIQHLIFVDGTERVPDAMQQLKEFERPGLDVIILPYPTGTNRFNGHRMYASGSYLCKGDWMMWLDDDNTIDPTHIESQYKNVTERPNFWSYSMRKIIDKDGKYVAHDDCESLGQWSTIIHPNDYFVDVNCYFLPRNIAIQMSPVWYRQFRTPGQLEIDRAMYMFVSNNFKDFDSTYEYTVNYRTGNTERSVQSEFFLRGNEAMLQRLDGKLPWKKK